MAENRLVHVEKSLLRQMSVLPISCCKIMKFSIFFVGISCIPCNGTQYQSKLSRKKNRGETQLSRDSALLTSILAFFFCSS